jgi:hypothetical protein
VTRTPGEMAPHQTHEVYGLGAPSTPAGLSRRRCRGIGRLEEVAATWADTGRWFRHLRWATRGGSAGVEWANGTWLETSDPADRGF